MARSRFLELLRGTLLETGVEAGESVTAGYNRLRRFMPTLGNCLRLDKDSLQAIGSWVEIPAGGGPQPTRKERAGHDMSLHYAGIGTDDLPDAYRGLPVREEHLPYSVVAVYVGSLGWRFTVLHGLAYGLESAVVAFNRFPSLGIGIARRCALALGAAYFDDQLAMEVIADADVSQRGIQLVFQLMGAPPQPAKSFAPTANRHYLATSVHTADFAHGGTIRFQPKTTTQAKVLSKLQDALEKKTLSRDEAGKLRGDLCWLFSMCSGHTGKIAGPLLTEKQHGSDPTLSASDIRTLQLLQAMVSISLPRDVHVRSIVLHHLSLSTLMLHSKTVFFVWAG